MAKSKLHFSRSLWKCNKPVRCSCISFSSALGKKIDFCLFSLHQDLFLCFNGKCCPYVRRSEILLLFSMEAAGSVCILPSESAVLDDRERGVIKPRESLTHFAMTRGQWNLIVPFWSTLEITKQYYRMRGQFIMNFFSCF